VSQHTQGAGFKNQVYKLMTYPPPAAPTPPFPSSFTTTTFTLQPASFVSNTMQIISAGAAQLVASVQGSSGVSVVGTNFVFGGDPSPSAQDVSAIAVSGYSSAVGLRSLTIAVTATYTAAGVSGYSDTKYRHLFNFAGLSAVRESPGGRASDERSGRMRICAINRRIVP
jgi:hypothetical protein